MSQVTTSQIVTTFKLYKCIAKFMNFSTNAEISNHYFIFHSLIKTIMKECKEQFMNNV